jgi:predicted Fe-S protein YdhL (DUF1289 family)
MDPTRGVCLGCSRTLDEIAGWAAMSEDLRERIMAELPGRLNVPKVAVPPLA